MDIKMQFLSDQNIKYLESIMHKKIAKTDLLEFYENYVFVSFSDNMWTNVRTINTDFVNNKPPALSKRFFNAHRNYSSKHLIKNHTDRNFDESGPEYMSHSFKTDI